jgi:hypothetical protein
MNSAKQVVEIDNHKRKMRALKPVLLVLFSFLLVMNIANLLFVIVYSSAHFFASTLFSHISIYSSRVFFISHCILSILTCGLILYLTVKKAESRILLIMLAFYLLIFLYPILAN